DKHGDLKERETAEATVLAAIDLINEPEKYKYQLRK
ncbi:unnamed protein product, partial [marine sediment metagenome]